MRKQLNLAAVLILGLLYMTSCTSQEESEVKNPNAKYIELYKNAYENLSNTTSITRAEQPLGAEVTVEEISSINSLEILTSYDKARLIEIENSDVFQNMKLESQQYLQDAKARFLQTHQVSDYSKILQFTQTYIKQGTHNILCLQQALDSERREEIKSYMALSAALVDAYGKEHIWQETFEIVSLNPCDKACIEKVALVLVGVAIDLAIDSTMPWATFITLANSAKAICDLITIYNEWVDCTKKLNPQG